MKLFYFRNLKRKKFYSFSVQYVNERCPLLKDRCEGYGLEPLYVDRLFPYYATADWVGKNADGDGM